jgi:hypothetical protein
MGWTDIDRGRLSSTFALTLASAVIASGAAIYVLYAAHAPRPPDASLAADGSISGDNMSVEERRELTRQMLKARRENPEVPEVVRPTPSTRTATTGTADRGATVDNAKARSDRSGMAAAVGPATASTPLPRTPLRRPEAATAASLVSANPGAPASVAAPGAVSTPATTPTATSAVGVSPPGLVPGGSSSVAPGVADGNLPTGSEQRGIGASVLSSISGIAGTAANATGNTVNWVIDLPGRAFSAGGRLLGGGDSSNPPVPQQPAQAQSAVPVPSSAQPAP